MNRCFISAANCLAALFCLLGSSANAELSYAAPVPTSREASESVSEAYLIGPGDKIRLELFQVPQLSGVFSIGPDGTIFLPRLRALYVEGLSLEELKLFLIEQYRQFVKNPEVYVSVSAYRPVRVYVGGEISRPGYYLISNGMPGSVTDTQVDLDQYRFKPTGSSLDSVSLLSTDSITTDNTNSSPGRWPTLFDALRASNGVTPYSNLSKVTVTRKQPYTQGGKIRADIDFLKLISEGDESVNIRLYDGDVIHVDRSPSVMREQLLSASRTNLSPDYVRVFVSGRVNLPGAVRLPQGSTLNQAIAAAGGTKFLRGSVEFLRFNADGTSDRRRFSYKDRAPANDFKNPVLMDGDVVRVNDSLFSAGVEVLNEVTGPAVGIYSVYSLFKP